MSIYGNSYRQSAFKRLIAISDFSNLKSFNTIRYGLKFNVMFIYPFKPLVGKLIYRQLYVYLRQYAR